MSDRDGLRWSKGQQRALWLCMAAMVVVIVIDAVLFVTTLLRIVAV